MLIAPLSVNKAVRGDRLISDALLGGRITQLMRLLTLCRRLTVMVLVMFASSFTLAAQVINVDDFQQHISLAASIDVLANEDPALTNPEIVYSQYRHNFSPVDLNDRAVMSGFDGRLWLRFAINNALPQTQVRWLQANDLVIDELKVYRVDERDDGQVIFVEMADALLKSQRYAPILIALDIPPNSISRYYVYMQAQQNFDLHLGLLKPDAFFEQQLQEVSVYSMAFGFMLMLLLLALFLAWLRKSSLYLWQGGYNLVCLAMVISGVWLGRSWLPNFDSWHYFLVYTFYFLANQIILLQACAYLQRENTLASQISQMYLALLLNLFLGVMVLFWFDAESPLFLLVSVITAFFTAKAYYRSYQKTHNLISLKIVYLRVACLFGLLLVVYFCQQILTLQQLVSPWLLAYLVIESVLLNSLFLLNDMHGDRLKQQQELLLSNRNSSNLAKTELLAEVSHDLRSPIAGILGMADLLQNSMLTAVQQEQLMAIKTSGQALLNQISAVNDRLQLQQSQKTIQKSAFELALLVEECAFGFRLQAEQRNIEFILNIHSDVPVIVEGDAARLRQVLQPLIANAIKYTAQGEVLVNVSRLASHPNYLSFRVEDSGRGMTQQQVLQIRQMNLPGHYELDHDSGPAKQGVQTAVQLLLQMDSNLRVESKLGDGSQFAFELPLPELSHQQDSVSEADINFSILRNKRILIVDDNQTCCNVLKQQTKSWGMLVNSCYDGNEALAMYRAKRSLGEAYDILIIDYDMPHLSGLEVAEKIKLEQAELPLMVMLTGLTLMPPEQITKDAGIQTVLNKPASQKLVRLTLSNLLHMQQRQQQKSAKSEKGFKVLIAEDNDVSRRIISKMMEMLGVDYKLVADGQLAVDAAQRQRYDLIFMDCEMPVMNGFEATQMIRQWQINKRQSITPIIALTAHIMGEHKQLSQDVGMADFLEKPVKLAELEAVIQRHTRHLS